MVADAATGRAEIGDGSCDAAATPWSPSIAEPARTIDAPPESAALRMVLAMCLLLVSDPQE
jgi:hypothetical protein